MNPGALSWASAYDTFKNYDRADFSIPISGVVTAGAANNFVGGATLLKDSSVTQIYYLTSLEPTKTYLFVADLLISRTGSTPSLPASAPYNIQFFILNGPSSIQITLSVFNPYSDSLTINTETFNFNAYTFIAPFA